MARVLVTENIAADGRELLKQHAEVDVKIGLSREELLERIGDYEALVVRSQTRVDAALIEAGTKLQVIGRAGVGVDNIDVEAATRRGIVVVNAPTGNTISAAEHALALLMASARHIPQANSRLKGGEWRRSEFMGVELRNKTLGIVGLGKVGSEVARRAQGMEMRVIAHDPFVSVDYARNLGVELVPLEELLPRSDFITIHTPLTQATRGLIGRKELERVKPTVHIINSARGGIVDELALYEAVEEGRVAGAAVDVFSQEPATDNILFKSDRIIVTPHLAASTTEAQTSVAVDVAEQIVALLRGEPARYAVNAPLISPETFTLLGPFIPVALQVGRLFTQLAEGQMGGIAISFEGEIAGGDTTPLKAAVLRGLLESISEEQVTVVNAELVARSRGLRIVEEKRTTCENYGNLITVRASPPQAGQRETTVAGTLMRGEVHIVLVNGYWLDVVPSGAYMLFCDHRDRPGLIGAVGTVTGKADINISFMQVGRATPRGRALMVLGLDEFLPEEQRQQILAIPDIHTAKLVRL